MNSRQKVPASLQGREAATRLINQISLTTVMVICCADQVKGLYFCMVFHHTGIMDRKYDIGQVSLSCLSA